MAATIASKQERRGAGFQPARSTAKKTKTLGGEQEQGEQEDEQGGEQEDEEQRTAAPTQVLSGTDQDEV